MKHFPSSPFWSSNIKARKNHMRSEAERGLDRKRDIRVRFRSPSPRLWRRVRRSVYLYLRPLMIEWVHRSRSSDATLPLNLPSPPQGQNTSTRHSEHWDVSSQEVKGQCGWPNLVTSLPEMQKQKDQGNRCLLEFFLILFLFLVHIKHCTNIEFSNLNLHYLLWTAGGDVWRGFFF